MIYMGGKVKYADSILNAIFKYLPLNVKYEYWVEPFVGGANVIDRMWRFNIKRIGNDNNYHLIQMYKALQNGWTPPDTITEEQYQTLKEQSKNVEQSDPNIAFAGIGCSYGAKWFGGFARGKTSKGTPRDYCRTAKNFLVRQKPKLLDVEFICGDYMELKIPDSSIVYCDPPYSNTTGYKTKFNHKLFWEWCDKLIDREIPVFVSEYDAPKHWKCIWEKQTNSSLTKNTGAKKATERLFTR